MEANKKVVINTKKTLQEIEGFGVSGAWWPQVIGGWDDENRNRIVDLLFDREKGIGLSIYRYNIGAGSGINIMDPWRRTESFEIEKGKYDWDKDKNAIWVLRAARNKGVEKFVTFTNSPPARMTRTGYVTGGEKGESNLRKDMYEDFAQYLIGIAKYLKEEEEIPIGYISPINEPQWDWNNNKGQEGCHYTADECLEVVKILINKIKENNIEVKVSAIEAGQWKDAYVYINKILGDKDVRRELDHFAIHSYWSDRNSKKRIANYIEKHYPEIKIWMSEWTEMKNGRDYGMNSALTLANTIHDDITIGKVTSWQYWIAVSKYNYRDGLVYTNEGTQEVLETKKLWALGNYSKFIKPGYLRIDAQTNNRELKVSAYIDEKRKKIVVVVINNSQDVITVGLLLETGEKFEDVNMFETSKENNLENIYVGSAKKKYSFNPESITTLLCVSF